MQRNWKIICVFLTVSVILTMFLGCSTSPHEKKANRLTYFGYFC